MKSAQLLGRDHVETGRIACVGEANLAIAISRGGADKTYSHKEPNEDAVCFAHGDAGCVVALADGHAGAEASQQAIQMLLDDAAPSWTSKGVARVDWRTVSEAWVESLHTSIVAEHVRSGSEARTTLSIVTMQPDAGYCGWVLAGDSHAFAIGAPPEECGPAGDPVRFLGSARFEPQDLALRSGTCEIGGLRALVLATDGLSESGIGVADPLTAAARAIEAAETQPAARRPLEAARGLAEQALAAHARQAAGDNIATAVCWLSNS